MKTQERRERLRATAGRCGRAGAPCRSPVPRPIQPLHQGCGELGCQAGEGGERRKGGGGAEGSTGEEGASSALSPVEDGAGEGGDAWAGRGGEVGVGDEEGDGQGVECLVLCRVLLPVARAQLRRLMLPSGLSVWLSLLCCSSRALCSVSYLSVDSSAAVWLAFPSPPRAFSLSKNPTDVGDACMLSSHSPQICKVPGL